MFEQWFNVHVPACNTFELTLVQQKVPECASIFLEHYGTRQNLLSRIFL